MKIYKQISSSALTTTLIPIYGFTDCKIIITTQLYIKQPSFSLFSKINKIIAIIALTYPKKYKKNINLEI